MNALPIPADQVFAQGMKGTRWDIDGGFQPEYCPNGHKMHPFGSNPVGILMFDPKAATRRRFATRIAPNSHRTIGCKVTPDEYKAALHLQSALGPVFQQRPFTIKGDELTYRVPRHLRAALPKSSGGEQNNEHPVPSEPRLAPGVKQPWMLRVIAGVRKPVLLFGHDRRVVAEFVR